MWRWMILFSRCGFFFCYFDHYQACWLGSIILYDYTLVLFCINSFSFEIYLVINKEQLLLSWFPLICAYLAYLVV